MKIFSAALMLATLALTSCSLRRTPDPRYDLLAFADSPFQATADFTVGDDSFRAVVSSSPEIPDDPQLPPTINASITFLSGSLSGISASFHGSDPARLSYSDLSLTVEPDMISGIADLVAAFFPDPDDYFSAGTTDDGILVSFSGDSKTEILFVDSLPKTIRTSRGGRVISAEISEFLKK